MFGRKKYPQNTQEGKMALDLQDPQLHATH